MNFIHKSCLWCDTISVTLDLDVPLPSLEYRSTPHFGFDFGTHILNGLIPSWVHAEIYYLILYVGNMRSIWIGARMRTSAFTMLDLV